MQHQRCSTQTSSGTLEHDTQFGRAGRYIEDEDLAHLHSHL